ncbi:alr0857 family protein [Pleurocapsa sp. FMAR1]|uniref:alr0857 family protein n=1 Tax=Pleurocapsa sp. FMAR1 TaxID=3040204 RepID=UPI0029C84493|nr:alr0857 family protein [Pleurocapsa sp. FMAR1]
MLKITYLEEGIYLEYLEESIEAWKANRILVSLRAGINIFVESSTACLVIPIDSRYLVDIAKLEAKQLIEVFPCDEEYLEVIVPGTWVSQSEDSEEGIFVCKLGLGDEYLLYSIWQESQVGSSLSID